MAFMILATGFYINAWYVHHLKASNVKIPFDVIDSAKGEECIPQTWDMFHEK
jgi:hypothetical protein